MGVTPQPDRDGRGSFIDRVRAAQQRLAAAVARAGLKNDPYAEVIDAQIATLDILAETALLATPAITAADIDKLNKAAGENNAFHARQELNHSIRALVALTRRRTVALCCGFVVGVLLVGVLCGIALQRWALTHPDIPGLTCQNQDGGRYCGLWIVAPEQQSTTVHTPTPPATTPMRGRQ